MANEYYISAGIVPNDTGESESANQYFITAGLIPDDTEEAPPTEYIPRIIIF